VYDCKNELKNTHLCFSDVEDFKVIRICYQPGFGIEFIADQRQIFRILRYFFLSAIEGGYLMQWVLARNHPHYVHIVLNMCVICVSVSE
jgi:hypothetical protein